MRVCALLGEREFCGAKKAAASALGVSRFGLCRRFFARAGRCGLCRMYGTFRFVQKIFSKKYWFGIRPPTFDFSRRLRGIFAFFAAGKF